MGRKAILVLVVVLVVGCGADSEPDSVATPLASISTAKVTTKIIGASPKQETILREILAGLGPSPVESVEVVHDIEEGWRAPPNAVGLDVRHPKANVYGAFHAELVGQTFVRRSFELDLAPIAYITDGEDASAGLYDPAEELAEPTLTVSEARAQAKRVRKLAESHGAAVRRLELLKPDRLAFVIELQADDVAGFLQNGLEETLYPIDLGRHRGFEGYLKVLDAEGKPALETGGGHWMRKDLVSCGPYRSTLTYGLPVPPPPPPPPCPAEREQQRDAPVPVATPPRSGPTTKIVGASPKQASVLEEILAGLGPTKLDSIEITRPGDVWKTAPPGAVGIRIDGPNEDMLSIWHAWLVADAFEERSKELDLPPLAYVSDPDGEMGVGGEDDQEERTVLTVEAAQPIAKRLRPAFQAHGAEVRHLELVHPKRPAFVIELEADDPAAFLLFDFPAVLSPPDAGLDGGLGGVYTRVIDTEGDLVFEWAIATVPGGTRESHWIRPDLQGCDPIKVSGPPGRVVPPCPAEAQSPSRQ